MKIKNILFLSAACLLSAVQISGCGYTTRSMLSEKYRTIYITPFVNKIDLTREGDVENKYRIYRPALETDLTRSLINRFIWDGNLKVAKTDSADLTLKGELVELRRDPVRFTDSEDVSEYRVNILVNISLWDNKENKLLWEENNFTGDYTYFTTYCTMPNVTKLTDDQALPAAVTDLSRRIVERVVEQW